MKQRIFTLILLAMVAMTSFAQRDLDIGKVLDGRYQKNPATTDVTITGEKLSTYHLVLYHSLTVVDDEEIMDAIAAAFLSDQRNALVKDLSYVGSYLYYGFYQYKEGDDIYNRYAFFKDMRHAPQGAESKVTLIFMEGPASLKSLKAKFAK